jgi:hypothetical protein
MEGKSAAPQEDKSNLASEAFNPKQFEEYEQNYSTLNSYITVGTGEFDIAIGTKRKRKIRSGKRKTKRKSIM